MLEKLVYNKSAVKEMYRIEKKCMYNKQRITNIQTELSVLKSIDQ